MICRNGKWIRAIAFILWQGIACARAQAEDRPIDFNRDIRPILSENCFYCHGQDGAKRRADLRMDDRQAAIDAGAIMPGDPDNSEMIRRLLSSDPEEAMPPPKANRHVSAEQIALLTRWVREGAKYSNHWAYVAPVRPEMPAVKNNDWVRNPIDRFVLAKLEQEGLSPSPEADRTTLIRRLSNDLIGLPPTPEEVDAFVADNRPDAYERLVDRLLENPHYGERMILPWLDAARYADSNGFQQDGDTWQWVWRDWLVGALNNDMPFDQLTIWQLAGDLLPNATPEQKIATAFNRNHMLNGEGGAIAEEQRNIILFDRVDTTATTWLGLTVACAQCHDHKYDPIKQQDYYSLMDAFNRVPETGVPRHVTSKMRIGDPVIDYRSAKDEADVNDLRMKLASAKDEAEKHAKAAFDAWKASIRPSENLVEKGLPASLVALVVKPDDQRSDNESKQLDEEMRKHFDTQVYPKQEDSKALTNQVKTLQTKFDDSQRDLEWVMVMSDAKPRQTYILDRGDYLSPKDKVSFNTPAFLPPLPKDAPRNRLGLAQWLVSTENPLVARVQVNRMWQQFFGLGIVKTSEDFGVQSEYPIHGPLLDWLAVEYRQRGWSTKHLHRMIVTSAAYRQSSKATPELLARDSDNRLIARASRMRMPAMVLRDEALAAAGLLDQRIGGTPVYPYQPDAIWESLAITKERDFTYPKSNGSDLFRKSLYTFWRRTVGPANMFDASNRQTCRVRAASTSTPLHALTTLNDETWVEAARGLAERSIQSSTALDDRLAFAIRQLISRKPSEADLMALRRAYEKQRAIYQADAEGAKALLAVGMTKRDESIDPIEHAAMTSVCLMILNLDETLTRE